MQDAVELWLELAESYWLAVIPLWVVPVAQASTRNRLDQVGLEQH